VDRAVNGPKPAAGAGAAPSPTPATLAIAALESSSFPEMAFAQCPGWARTPVRRGRCSGWSFTGPRGRRAACACWPRPSTPRRWRLRLGPVRRGLWVCLTMNCPARRPPEDRGEARRRTRPWRARRRSDVAQPGRASDFRVSAGLPEGRRPPRPRPRAPDRPTPARPVEPSWGKRKPELPGQVGGPGCFRVSRPGKSSPRDVGRFDHAGALHQRVSPSSAEEREAALSFQLPSLIAFDSSVGWPGNVGPSSQGPRLPRPAENVPDIRSSPAGRPAPPRAPWVSVW